MDHPILLKWEWAVERGMSNGLLCRDLILQVLPLMTKAWRAGMGKSGAQAGREAAARRRWFSYNNFACAKATLAGRPIQIDYVRLPLERRE